VTRALGQAASPRLANYYAAHNAAEFRTLLLKLVGIGALLGTVGVLVVLAGGRAILTLLYTPEYGEYTNVFIWLMVAAGINYVASFLGYGITAARYFFVQAPLFALAACVCAAASFWLVPTAGLHGAAYALVLVGVVQLAATLAILKHALGRLRTKKDLEMGA
jgi:O-antigen/teichoic acid export membrane protein